MQPYRGTSLTRNANATLVVGARAGFGNAAHSPALVVPHNLVSVGALRAQIPTLRMRGLGVGGEGGAIFCMVQHQTRGLHSECGYLGSKGT